MRLKTRVDAVRDGHTPLRRHLVDHSDAVYKCTVDITAYHHPTNLACFPNAHEDHIPLLTPCRYRQQMEVFKQTQAAAGLVGAASAGDGLRRDADTQPRDVLPRNAGVRDPGVEASVGTGGGRLSGRVQGMNGGAGAVDASGGQSRDQEIRDVRAGMLGVDPGAFPTRHAALGQHRMASLDRRGPLCGCCSPSKMAAGRLSWCICWPSCCHSGSP